MTAPDHHPVQATRPIPDPGSPRVLVVDADDRTRECIVGILGIRHQYRIVGSAGHAAAAESLAREHHPDVMIVDPRLPEVSDGIGLIRRLRAIDPRIHVLALGWSPELESRALHAGAHAFLRKTLKPGDLATAITRCMSEDGPGAIPQVGTGHAAGTGPE